MVEDGRSVVCIYLKLLKLYAQHRGQNRKRTPAILRSWIALDATLTASAKNLMPNAERGTEIDEEQPHMNKLWFVLADVSGMRHRNGPGQPFTDDLHPSAVAD